MTSPLGRSLATTCAAAFATAALLAGRTENTPLDCPPTRTVDNYIFKNAMNESFGMLNLIKAFAVSCNTAFVNLRESMTEADMKRAAELYGFDDRGTVAEGKRADLNVIDLENLRILPPVLRHDLPTGVSRILQPAEGYLATLVAGEVTRRHDADTGVRSGRLVRGSAA